MLLPDDVFNSEESIFPPDDPTLDPFQKHGLQTQICKVCLLTMSLVFFFWRTGLQRHTQSRATDINKKQIYLTGL